MDSKKLNMLLIENFPNLKDKYIEEVVWQEGDDTGSHTVYGDVLTPYLEDCLAQNNEMEVIQILNFIERILELDCEYSNNVMAVSVLEGTEYTYRNSELFNNNCGKLTKKVVEGFREYNLKFQNNE